MKRMLSLIMIFLIVTSIFAFFTPKALADKNIIFEDDFESCSVGNFPPPSSGWSIVYDGAGGQYQKITNSYYSSPTKSLQLMGSYGWSVVVKKDFSFSSNKIGYEVSVMSSDLSGGAYFGFLNQPISTWGRSYAVVGFGDGYIGGGGLNFQPFTPYVWYKIRVVLDINSRNFNVWINDVLVAQNLVELNDPREILSFQLSVGWKNIAHYYDDVKVFSVTSGVEASISPSSITTSIGGTAAYNIAIKNYQNTSDVFSMGLNGLNQSWYSFSKTQLYMAAWEVNAIRLNVTIPDNPSNVGVFNFYVTISGLLTQKTVNATLFVLLNPIMNNLEPQDNSTIGSTVLLISWRTSSNASSDVYMKRLGDLTFNHTAGGYGTEHYVSVYNLSRNTDYVWYAYSKTLYGNVTSNVRILHVSNGISFTQESYTFNVERDYAQHASISVVNTDTKSHDLLLQAINPYDDLIVGFVGPGSVDENVTLQSGETRSVDFEIFAQDAMQQNYTFRVKLTNLGNESIVDYALVNVNVRQPNINLALVEDSIDPTTLSKTITATNYGDPITDLYIGTSDNLTGKVYFNPTISHANLPTGGSLTFEAVPVLTTGFTGCQGLITATSAGRVIASLPVNFTLPPGKSVYSVTVPQVSIEFSKYYDMDDSPNTNPLPTQLVESYLANGTKIFASQIIVDVYQNETPAYGANVSLTVWDSSGAVAALEYCVTDFTGKALFNVVGRVGNYSYQAQLVDYGLETEKRNFSVGTSCLYEIRPNDITWLDVSDGRSTYNLTESIGTVTLTQAPFTFRAKTAATGENATFGLVLRWDLDVFKRVYIPGSIQNDILTFRTSGIPAGNFTAIVYYYSLDNGLSVSSAINVTNTDSTGMYIQGNYTYYLPFPFNSTHFIRLVTERSVSARDPAVAFDLVNIEPADTQNSLYELEYVIVSNETVHKDFQFYVNTTEGELYNTTFHLDLEPGIPVKVNFTIPVEFPNGTLRGEFDATLSTDSASVTTKTTPQLNYIYDSRIWVGSSRGILDPILRSIFPPLGAYETVHQNAGLVRKIVIETVPQEAGPVQKELMTCGAFTLAGEVSKVGGTVLSAAKDGWDFFTKADDVDKVIIATEYGGAAFLVAIAGSEAFAAAGTVLLIGGIMQCVYDAIKVSGEAAGGSTGVGVCKVSKTCMSYCTNCPVVSAQVPIDPLSADVVQAAVVVKFSLPWSRDTYRPHNVHLFINGIEVGTLTNTIPEGYYIFPFNSSILNYANNGPSMNTITMKMDNLNGGHYVVTSDWEIILHIKQLTLSVVATNQSEANSLVEQLTGMVASVPDFGIYSGGITCSNSQPREGQNLTFTARVFNFGTVGMSNVPVDLYVDSVKVGSAIISFMPALANQTVEFGWTPSRGTHEITIMVNGAKNIPESDYSNNRAQAAIVVGADDVAVVNVTSSKTIIGQGFNTSIKVSVTNQGSYTETFSVTLYANTTSIATQTITLTSGNSTTITFTWNTSGFAKGNYTIWAYAWPVPGETHTEDNSLTDGWVTITTVGDFGGGIPPTWEKVDGAVDWKDVFLFRDAYLNSVHIDLADLGGDVPPKFYACDGVVDWKDVYLFRQCYLGLGP